MYPEAHFRLAIQAGHPCLNDVALDAVALAVRMQSDMGTEVVRWRSQILREVQDIVDDLTPDWQA
eukprot:16451947-Heterocapsa_arctica.AAC.1